ncbi:MAG: hypothetical protein MJB14_22690 [Spirochaetes bacterium]|nr:hypothetical protein [Spirochaetota bacterium]
MRLFYLLLVLFFSFNYLFTLPKCDIVHTKIDQPVPIYSDPENKKEILNYIPASYQNLEFTWNTKKINGEYWIEVNYLESRGWIKRHFVTRKDLWLSNDQQQQVEKILLELIRTIQQQQVEPLNKQVYFIRGLYFYSRQNNKLFFTTKNKLPLFINYALTNEKPLKYRSLKNMTQEVNEFLKHDFEIEILSKNKYQLPAEIINFQQIVLKNNQKTMLIGIELWNNQPFLAYVAF